MKFPKKAASLVMALAMTVGLTVPAMAASRVSVITASGEQVYAIDAVEGLEHAVYGESQFINEVGNNAYFPVDAAVDVIVGKPGLTLDIAGCSNVTVTQLYKADDGKLHTGPEYAGYIEGGWEFSPDLPAEGYPYTYNFVNRDLSAFEGEDPDVVWSPEWAEWSSLQPGSTIKLHEESYYLVCTSGYPSNPTGPEDQLEDVHIFHITSNPEALSLKAVPDSGIPYYDIDYIFFQDIQSTAYYADAVKWAVDKGVTSGTSATTFSPDATCTTAQILTFLWRANGSPEPAKAAAFADVSADAYYAKAAAWAAEKGLVSGTTFGGDTPCTRMATVTYLWKLAGKPAASTTAAFADVSNAADDLKAVSWAVEQGITTGTGATTFSPSGICTRGQIVTFLHRDLAQ